MVIVTTAAWERMRDHFNEDEKQLLRDATMGPCICPPGAILDEDMLVQSLRAKLHRWNKVQKGDARR
jgi:hypothetical protein